MKTLSSILIIMLPAYLLLSCKNGANNTNSADATRDTSKFYAVVDKEDSTFVVNAVNSGIAEVELGKLAKERGITKQVKNYGALMVKDHSKSNNKLIALAKAKKITLPASSDTEEQKTIDQLSKKSGKDFDNAYISEMINDHEKDIKLFENATKTCSDPELKAYANKSLPALKRHLDAITAIRESRK